MRKVEIAAHPPHQQFIKPYGCQSSFRILQQFSFCDIQFVFQHVPARIAIQFIPRHVVSFPSSPRITALYSSVHGYLIPTLAP